MGNYIEKEKMQSFRTELENPLVQKEIIDLEKKIHLFQEGKVDENVLESLRLCAEEFMDNLTTEYK